MQSKATTVAAYLKELPPDRRAAIQAVREVLLANLDKDYEEGMQYGMIGYFVPHRIYPAGYHCDPRQPLPFAGLASQKNHMALYLMCTYLSPEQESWFRSAWARTGKKLDMGKSCIRFRKIEDLPLDVIGEAVRRVPVGDYIAYYEQIIRNAGRSKAARNASKKTAKESPKKSAEVSANKSTKKKTSAKAGKKSTAKTAPKRSRSRAR